MGFKEVVDNNTDIKIKFKQPQVPEVIPKE
jgi:hypothetical protein